jgi:S-adenosylmethionine-dependent methyltransferase
MSIKQDRNFDSLIERFEQKVYDTHKGDWRLKLLKEDLGDFYNQPQPQPLAIWDAGCGLAQISAWLAEQGHHLTLCDISRQMLMRAQQQFEQLGLKAQFFQEAAQSLAPRLPQFDLVLLHAVLEWLAQPMPALEAVARQVKPGGYLSLMFYNRNAMIYTNALKGGWRWKHLLDDSYLGKGKRLTPPNPQYPHEVIARLEQWGFTIARQTGIRVFHDYLSKNVLEDSDVAELFELEYQYCRLPTYRDMGRYIHLLARRSPDVEQ